MTGGFYRSIHEFSFGKFYERHTRNDIYLYPLHFRLRILEVRQSQAKIFSKAEKKNESYREIEGYKRSQFTSSFGSLTGPVWPVKYCKAIFIPILYCNPPFPRNTTT